MEVIVFDEISLSTMEQFYTFESRFKAAYLTTVTDNAERMRRQHLPFAGVHIIILGDFYQLPGVRGAPIYVQYP